MRIRLTWSHTDGVRHFLEARIEHNESRPVGPVQLVTFGQEGSMAVELPRPVLVTLRASTVNGEVRVAGLATEALALGSLNGPVAAEARGLDAAASSMNGEVVLRLEPWRHGSVEASSVNAHVEVVVPEGPRHGYEVRASTVNGRAEIALEDGETRARGDEESRDLEFRTSGFASREVRTRVFANSVNGDVRVGPS